MHRQLADLIAFENGVISRGTDPSLIGQIDYAVRSGELVRVLPGVYAHRSIAADWYTKVRAVGLWNPDAVITHTAAAAMTFWKGTNPDTVAVAGVHVRASIPGFRFSRRKIPAELVTTRDRQRITHPDLTALDLIDTVGGDAIDDGLRARMVTIPGMHHALELTPYRAGNRRRHQLVLDSRTTPWSSGERTAHRQLREAGLTEWVANELIIIDGQELYPDVRFLDCPLVAEIDGLVHLRPSRFTPDRVRGNLFLVAGFDVLRFTTPMLEDGLLVPTVLRARQRYGLS